MNNIRIKKTYVVHLKRDYDNKFGRGLHTFCGLHFINIILIVV